MDKEMRQEAPMGYGELNKECAQAPNPDKLSTEGARNKFLAKVQGIVNNDRNKDYGTAEDSFNTIADFWATYLYARFGFTDVLSAIDVAAMMDLMKTARIASNPIHMDSWVDKAGYSACAGGILEQSLEACEISNKETEKYNKEGSVTAGTITPMSASEAVALIRKLFPSFLESDKEVKPNGKTVVRLLYYVKKNGDIWTPFVEVNDLAKGDLYHFCKTNGYHAVCTTDNEVYSITHGWSKIKRKDPIVNSSNTFYWYTTKEDGKWHGFNNGVVASDDQLNSLANDNGYHALSTSTGREWDIVNGWRTPF